MSQWPPGATEPVEVRAPDEAWQQRGQRACRLLDDVLAPWLVAPVEHVGSTAVPKLPAKPILDLQAAVADLGCTREIAAALAAGGWHYVPPELDQRPWRRFFVHVVGGRRAAHLHVMTSASPCWGEQLAFRDALRADPRLAASYAELKRALAARDPNDREAYTAAKHDFIRTALSGQL